LRDFEHREDRPLIDQLLAEANQILEPFNHEFRIITPSGSLKWVQVTSHPSRQPDGSTHWDGIVTDMSDRKRLEQEQNRLIEILQSTTDFIGICQPEKGILWQNQPFQELRPDLNIFDERIPISKLYPKWAFDILKKEGLPAAMKQGTWSGETALLTPSGKEIPTSQVIIAHKSEQGEVEYLSTILRDISDRKAAETALTLSEARAKAAFEQAAVGIAENSIQFDRITQVNNYFCEMLGYTRSELLQLTIKDVTYPEDIAESKAYITRLYSGEIDCFTINKRYVCKDGSIVWAVTTVSLIDIPGEKAQSSLAIIKDISKYKEAKLALQDVQAKFRRITENVPGMIYRWILRADGGKAFIYVSSKVREFFELEPEAVIQDETLIWDKMHPDDVSQLQDAIAFSTDILQPFKHEFRLVLPQKGLRWVQINSQPERLDNGDVVWDGVMIDISDRKHYEQQLQRVSERLEMAVESAQIGIWEWNHQENQLVWDDQMFAIYGLPTADSLGNGV